MVLQVPDARSSEGQDLGDSGRGHLGPSESVCATSLGDRERLVLAMYVAGRGLCPDASAYLELYQLDTLDYMWQGTAGPPLHLSLSFSHTLR